MSFAFNPISGNFDIVGTSGGGGGAVSWKTAVADEASLPALGNTAGDARVALDSGNIFVWDGSAWANQSTGSIPLTTATLNDNTASPTQTAAFPVASESSVFIRYSLVRGVVREVATLHMVTDGTNAYISRGDATNNGDPGVTFTADVSGGNMRLLYTTTNTGSNASFKFKVESWLA